MSKAKSFENYWYNSKENIASESIHSCWEYYGPVLINARGSYLLKCRTHSQYSSVFRFGFSLPN